MYYFNLHISKAPVTRVFCTKHCSRWSIPFLLADLPQRWPGSSQTTCEKMTISINTSVFLSLPCAFPPEQPCTISLAAHCLFSSQKRKALIWSDLERGLKYVGIIRSLTLPTYFYDPHAMICLQTTSLPTLQILFNLCHHHGAFPGGLHPA